MAFFSVSVAGQDVTSPFSERLIEASINVSAGEAAASARIVLDDSGVPVRYPAEGAPVTVAIGNASGTRVFTGEVDTQPAWSFDRAGGSILVVTAKSVSLRGKAKEPAERYFDQKSVADMLREAGGAAGISVSVHQRFAARVLDYEAQDNESFIAFAQRLAREHGASFGVDGTRAWFVPRNEGQAAGAAALPVIAATRGVNLISADGMTPSDNRPRYAAERGRWWDIRKAEMVIERVRTGEDVSAEDVLRELAPDADAARWRAEAKKEEGRRNKGTGSVTIDGEPRALPEGICLLSGCRPGIDGAYSIESVTDALDRSGGYLTRMSLGRPEGGAGSDAR